MLNFLLLVCIHFMRKSKLQCIDNELELSKCKIRQNWKEIQGEYRRRDFGEISLQYRRAVVVGDREENIPP